MTTAHSYTTQAGFKVRVVGTGPLYIVTATGRYLGVVCRVGRAWCSGGVTYPTLRAAVDYLARCQLEAPPPQPKALSTFEAFQRTARRYAQAAQQSDPL